jgi:Protein of unknown function DUF72
MSRDTVVPDRIRVGPAGWSYPDWTGQVYPKPQPRGFDPLRYLAQYFDAVEINSTFYRIPDAKMTQRWVERVADHPDVRFTAKLWQGFTHEGTASPSRRRERVTEGTTPAGERGMCIGDRVSRATRRGAAAGIGATPALEQIQNFAEHHLVPVFQPGEIRLPAGGAPEFEAVVQADQDHLGGDLRIGAQGGRERQPPVGIEFGENRFRHHIMHQEPALLIIQLLACGVEFDLPALGLVEPEAVVERFEDDHLPAGPFRRGWKGRQDDRGQPEQATGLGVNAEFPCKHRGLLSERGGGHGGGHQGPPLSASASGDRIGRDIQIQPYQQQITRRLSFR